MSHPIFLTENAYLPPFLCGRCGAQSEVREYYIDTGIDLDVLGHVEDGRLFLCHVCIQDIVDVDPNAFTKVYVDNLVASYQQTIAEANKVKNKWQDQVDKFKEIGIDLEIVWEQIYGQFNGGTPESEQIIDSSSSEFFSSTGTDERFDKPNVEQIPDFAFTLPRLLDP